MASILVLYSYWRSSAAYRVRIALNLLGLAHEIRAVNLAGNGGEQHGSTYRALNPQELVPLLLDGERRFIQSLAICEYLDEHYADRRHLLPEDARSRARVRGLAQLIACDIHPIGNLRVLQRLDRALEVDADTRKAWSRHWIQVGFNALETLLDGDAATGEFCHGDTPGLADLCLVPQVYNARRWELDMAAWPTIARIDARCRALDAFSAARPEAQPDAPPPA